MWIFDSGILKWLIIAAGVVISIRRKIRQNSQQSAENQADEPSIDDGSSSRERVIIESLPRESKDLARESLGSHEQYTKTRRVEPLTKKVTTSETRENFSGELCSSNNKIINEAKESKDIKKIKFDLRQAVIQSVILERKFEE